MDKANFNNLQGIFQEILLKILKIFKRYQKERLLVKSHFKKKYAFQTILRYIWLMKQKCPVYFYKKKQISKITYKHNLKVNFYDCGPIWVVEFKKK